MVTVFGSLPLRNGVIKSGYRQSRAWFFCINRYRQQFCGSRYGGRRVVSYGVTRLSACPSERIRPPYTAAVLTAAPDRLRISDLPLFQAIRDNYAAANFIGLRVRYTRHFNAAFLNAFYPGSRNTADFAGGSKKSGEVFPGSSRLTNTVLQNNEIGLHTSYATRLEFDGLRVEADDQLVRGPAPSHRNFELEAATGIEMNHNSNSQHLLSNVRVVGYPIGERRSPNDDEVRARIRVDLVNCDEPFITWDKDTIKRNRLNSAAMCTHPGSVDPKSVMILSRNEPVD